MLRTEEDAKKSTTLLDELRAHFAEGETQAARGEYAGGFCVARLIKKLDDTE